MTFLIQLCIDQHAYTAVKPFLGKAGQRLVIGDDDIAQPGSSSVGGNPGDGAAAVRMEGMDMDIAGVSEEHARKQPPDYGWKGGFP